MSKRMHHVSSKIFAMEYNGRYKEGCHMLDKTHYNLEKYLTFYYEYSKSHRTKTSNENLKGSKGGKATKKKH